MHVINHGQRDSARNMLLQTLLCNQQWEQTRVASMVSCHCVHNKYQNVLLLQDVESYAFYYLSELDLCSVGFACSEGNV